MEEFMGTVKLFAFNWEVKNWAFCDGRLMSIAQNTALFSLLGTTYGGDGHTTFALPDLRGRVAISIGQGPGLSDYVGGQVSGTENNSLFVSNLPPHNHTGHVVVSSTQSSASTAARGAAIATPGTSSGRDFTPTLGYTAAGVNPDTPLADTTVVTNLTGSGLPVNNLQPYLAMSYQICLYGIFPSRS